jgi:glutamyl-Q tRNA(Asp) synthetase
VRARVDDATVFFVDGLQGRTDVDLATATGDYVIMRRDGLPAYHLAVVVDDAEQGITSVVRGIDLLESTAAHIHLQRALGLATPRYWHLPVVVNTAGQKLSKQTGAAAVAHEAAVATTVLDLLGAEPPAGLRGAPPSELWEWAGENWSLENLRARRSLAAPAV